MRVIELTCSINNRTIGSKTFRSKGSSSVGNGSTVRNINTSNDVSRYTDKRMSKNESTGKEEHGQQLSPTTEKKEGGDG